MPILTALIDKLTALDLAVFAINLFILLASRWIVRGLKKSSEDIGFDTKLWALRFINLTLMGLYLIAIFENQVTRQISLTGLTLLLAFLLSHFIQVFLLMKFGRVKEIEGEKYRSETYQSEMFGLLVMMLAFIVSILIIINIWGMTDWLQATSVLGGLLLLIYSTKDVWAPDNINGLMLLYNGDIEPGSVVQINDYNLLGIVIQTSLTQTVFRDLKQRHRVVLPNSKLRTGRIDILSKCPASGLVQFIDFKIAYGVTGERVETFLKHVWEVACERENALNNEKEPVIKLLETGDHAITWRLVYTLKNVYRLISARCAVNRVAYDLSLTEGIGLNTPVTHQVSLQQQAESSVVATEN